MLKLPYMCLIKLMICANVRSHSHKWLGMVESNCDQPQTLNVLLGQIKPRIQLLLAINFAIFSLPIALFVQHLLVSYLKFVQLFDSEAFKICRYSAAEEQPQCPLVYYL